MKQVLRLLLVDLKALLWKLRHDLGKELSALAASLILLATFGYVFDDFLNVQIATLSTAMREAFARVLAAIALLVGSLAAARVLARDREGGPSSAAMARHLGAAAADVRRYVWTRTALLVAVWHGAAWWLAAVLVTRIAPWVAVLAEAAMLAVSFGVARFTAARAARRLASPAPPASPTTVADGHPLRALVRWRVVQHLGRNRGFQAIYAAAAALVALGLLTYAGGAPLVAPVAAAFGSGVLVSVILALALAEDLTHAWTERALGVSHDLFVAAYVRFAAFLAGPLAALAVALALVATLARGEAMDLAGVSAALKPAAVLLVPPLFAPYVFFQIDARRPGVNAIAIVIVGLFLGTAVFAHWLALIVPFLAKSVIAGNQAGRFHRA